MYFQKPESALKRAEELEAVGKPMLALEAMHSLLTSRRHKQWSPVHEQIIIKYINICIEHQKGHIVKDGLHQYKNIVGLNAMSSLEKVIRHFLSQSEGRIEKAWAESRANHAAAAPGTEDAVTADVEDLEQAETPESVLLAAVSAESDKERSDRVVLTPWLKFLWEAYRTVLDILRNNAKLQPLYQATARQAFQFCLQYERKHEFRRLCDMLRSHKQQLYKHRDAPNSVDVNAPEVLRMNIETRFDQVTTAAKLELWQEAFKGIDEIADLISNTQSSPQPATLAAYYQKLAQILWKSKDYAFHAAALHALFRLVLSQPKAFKSDQLGAIASAVLLSAMSVPLAEKDSEAKLVDAYTSETHIVEKNIRLSNLVEATTTPSRSRLIEDAIALGVLDLVDPSLRALYKKLELDFNPLRLRKAVEDAFGFMNKEAPLAQYVQPLRNVMVMRLLQQVSQIYSSMKISTLMKLSGVGSAFEMERMLVQAVKDGVISMRLCHRTKSARFGTSMFGVNTASQGPRLQSLRSEMMRGQLTTLSQRLTSAMDMIDPKRRQDELEKRRAAVAANFEARLAREHRAILERKGIIEGRKEHLEALSQQRAMEEQEKARLAHENAIRMEQERLEEEARKREEARIAREREEIARGQAMERIAEMKKTVGGAKALADIKPEELAKMDAETIKRKQLEQLDKEKREQQSKLKAMERRFDYMERAKRLVEIPKLREHFETLREQNLKWWKEQQEEKVRLSKEQHAKAMAMKSRLARMQEPREEYLRKAMARRRQEHKKQLEEFQELLAKQEEERRQREEREKEERERLVKEERARQEAERKRAEEEKKRQEMLRKQEEEERQRKEEEQRRVQEERQRQLEKMQELERRRLERAAELERKQKEKAGLVPPIKGGPRKDSGGIRAPPARHDSSGAYVPPAGRKTEESDWRSGSTREETSRRPGRREGGPSRQATGPREDSWRSTRQDAGAGPKREIPLRKEPSSSEPRAWRNDSPRKPEDGPRRGGDSWRDSRGQSRGGERGGDRDRDRRRPARERTENDWSKVRK